MDKRAQLKEQLHEELMELLNETQELKEQQAPEELLEAKREQMTKVAGEIGKILHPYLYDASI